MNNAQATQASVIGAAGAAQFVQPDAQWVRIVERPSASCGQVDSDGFAQLLDDLRAQQPELRDALRQHGGVLLRGWPVDSAARFETLADCFLAEQASYIGGVSRRSRIHNNVYNTTEAPSDVVIEQHLEATHTPRPPELILFNCQIAPGTRGETPLASFIELYERLPKSVTEPLETESVVYTRELIDRDSALYRALPSGVKQSLALSWQEVSGCNELGQARHALETEGYDVTSRGSRRLRTRCTQPVIETHPHTGRKGWYLSDQITRVLPWYTRWPRRALRSVMGMEFGLASGRSLPASVTELVHTTLQQVRFSFAWQPGDVLVLDNHQMSHGRNPFSGERLILTAFG